MTKNNQYDCEQVAFYWLLIVALLGTAHDPAQAAESKVASYPNIVYILADDLGYGDVGCYNPDSKIPTPNLDRLASQGMRFTDAHSPSAVCSPTRYALLTGRYSWRSRLQNGVLPPWGAPLIAADRLTVAALLEAHGYMTACIGKWHLGWEWPTKDGKPPATGDDRLSNVDFTQPITGGPTTRGFVSYFGVDLPNFPPYCFIDNDRTVGIPSLPNRPEFNRPGPMLPDWHWVNIVPAMNERATKFIAERSAKSCLPFFLYMPLTAPHYPIVPGEKAKGRSRAGDYGDFVAEVDDTVGQVLDALERAGVAEKTLVIFTSDNGPETAGEVQPGAYARIREFGHYSMGALRGTKRDLWEGGHRVPFIARWPKQIKPGSVSAETICHVDFLATAAAILDVQLPDFAAEDSYNLLPVLRGAPGDKPLREATVHHGGSGKFAIRQGEWVLLCAPSGDDNGGPARNGEPEWLKQERGYVAHDEPGELYNLRADLSQRENLYAQHPEIVTRLRSLLEKYIRDGRSTPGQALKNDVPIVIDKRAT